MTDGIETVTLKDLGAAADPEITDTFAVCQNPMGCGETDALKTMTVGQLAEFILDQVPEPPESQYLSDIVTSADQLVIASSGDITGIASLDLPAGKWIVTGEAWFSILSGQSSNVTRFVSIIAPAQALPAEPA